MCERWESSLRRRSSNQHGVSLIESKVPPPLVNVADKDTEETVRSIHDVSRDGNVSYMSPYFRHDGKVLVRWLKCSCASNGLLNKDKKELYNFNDFRSLVLGETDHSRWVFKSIKWVGDASIDLSFIFFTLKKRFLMSRMQFHSG